MDLTPINSGRQPLPQLTEPLSSSCSVLGKRTFASSQSSTFNLFDLLKELIRGIFFCLNVEDLKKIGLVNRACAQEIPFVIKMKEINNFIHFLITHFRINPQSPSNKQIQAFNRVYSIMRGSASLLRAFRQCRQAATRIVNLFTVEQLIATPWPYSSDRYWVILTLLPRKPRPQIKLQLRSFTRLISDLSQKKHANCAIAASLFFGKKGNPKRTSPYMVKKYQGFRWTSKKGSEFKSYAKNYFSFLELHHWSSKTGFTISQVDQMLKILDETPDPFIRFTLLDIVFKAAYGERTKEKLGAYFTTFTKAPLKACIEAITQASIFRPPIQNYFTPNQLDEIIVQISELPLAAHQLKLISALRCLSRASSLSKKQEQKLTIIVDQILEDLRNPFFEPLYRLYLIVQLSKERVITTEIQADQFALLKKHASSQNELQ